MELENASAEKEVAKTPEQAPVEEMTGAAAKPAVPLGEMPKRKRGRPRKQTLLTGIAPQTMPAAASLQAPEATMLQKDEKTALQNAQQTIAPASQIAIAPAAATSQSTAAKPLRKKSSKKKLALTVFDKDALKLVRRREGTLGQISSKLGVGEPAVAQRLAEIVQAGLLEKGENNFHLTVKGYNEYAPDSLETSLEEKIRKRLESARKKENRQAQATQKNATQANEQLQMTAEKEIAVRKSGEIIVLPENGAPQQRQRTQETQPMQDGQVEQKTGQREIPSDKVDLSELLARGAPKEGEQAQPNTQKPRRSERTVAEINVTPKPANASATNSKEQGGDKCVLCRTGFVLSVAGGNPKYGHCFCGAAYHQDCYHGVQEASGECIQCGKKLDIIIDKASLDEVRKIKDVFG